MIITDMREIKFRAWKWNILEEKWKMLQWEQIKTNCMDFFVNPCRFTEYSKDNEPHKIMQFTGLHDKNGKEIYEGDIVNYAVKKKLCDCKKETDLFLGKNNFCPDCGKKVENKDFVKSAEIRFMEGGFVLYSEDKKKEYYQAWQTFISECYIEWKEVIGNIHENKDLLP